MATIRLGDSLDFVVFELGQRAKTVSGCVVDTSSSCITILLFETFLRAPTDVHPTVFKLTTKKMQLVLHHD
jgi:hypothetical protein